MARLFSLVSGARLSAAMWLVLAAHAVPLASEARADEPVAAADKRRMQECLAEAKHVRITGAFGCLELKKPVVSEEGVWCEHTEPCEFTADAGPKQFYWEQIDRIEVGQTHGREAASITYIAVVLIATTVIIATSNKESIAAILLPIAALAVVIPYAIGSELFAGLIGSQVVTWEVCYQKPPPTPPGR
jgi:hypothetical protein